MDPISIVIGALAAGVLAGAQDAASSSVGDAYAKLKAVLQERLKGRQAAETALAEHENEPDAWRSALEHELTRAGVDNDPVVLARARELLAATGSEGRAGGDTWNIDARHSSSNQFGKGNVQYNQWRPDSGREG